jgi:hypothetical protein
MKRGIQQLASGGISAASIVLVALAITTGAQAQPAAGQPQMPANPELFKWQTAPAYDLGNIDTTRFQKWQPDKPIDQFDFGTSLLRLESMRTPNTFLPSASNDASDLSDTVMPGRHGKKRYRSSEQYFGFTFTRPTN